MLRSGLYGFLNLIGGVMVIECARMGLSPPFSGWMLERLTVHT